jgi:uncharacterized protein YgiM (DUF1202 family)
MKRLIYILTLLSLACASSTIPIQTTTPTPRAEPTATSTDPEQWVVTAETLRVRVKPATAYAVVHEIKQGELVTVSEWRNGWAKR